MSSNGPLRKCIACAQMKEKSELFKVVRTEDGKAAYDETGKMNGRGAYICKNTECIKKAEKTNAVFRNLKVKADESLFKELSEKLSEQ